MRFTSTASFRIVALFVLGAAHGVSAAGSLHQSTWESKYCNYDVLQRAANEIRRKDYEQGRRLLKKVASSECSLMSAALLLIADTHYRESGSLHLEKASEEYTRWLGLFPEHEFAPLVMKKIIEIHMRQLNGRGGDNHIALAYRALLKIQDSYPQYRDDPEVQEYLMVTQELLADHNLKVARFYLDVRESAQAAMARCLEVITKYPSFSRTDTALWYLAQADEVLAQTEDGEDNIAKAIASYQRIAREHSDSEYRDRAIERLTLLGQPVPEPDQEINTRFRERASKIKSILVNGYVLSISQRGVLLDEEDDVERDGLNRVLNQVSTPSASTAILRQTN
jgi:outer membrane assembly lipoprotein YfiO